jgi:hypothetical protein
VDVKLNTMEDTCPSSRSPRCLFPVYTGLSPKKPL